MAGDYIDDRKKVALNYIKGMFFFDLVTSFPVSFFEIAAQAVCDRAAMATGDAASSEVDGGQLRIIRVIKPLR